MLRCGSGNGIRATPSLRFADSPHINGVTRHDGHPPWAHPTRILGVVCQDSTSRATSATSSAERSASVEAAFSRTCAGDVAPAMTDETTG